MRSLAGKLRSSGCVNCRLQAGIAILGFGFAHLPSSAKKHASLDNPASRQACGFVPSSAPWADAEPDMHRSASRARAEDEGLIFHLRYRNRSRARTMSQATYPIDANLASSDALASERRFGESPKDPQSEIGATAPSTQSCGRCGPNRSARRSRQQGSAPAARRRLPKIRRRDVRPASRPHSKPGRDGIDRSALRPT